MQDQYLNLRHHTLNDTLPTDISYSYLSESLPPENCPYNFCMLRVVHLPFRWNYWKLLRSYWKASEGTIGKHFKRDVFSITKTWLSSWLFVPLVEQWIFSIDMQRVGNESKDADQVLGGNCRNLSHMNGSWSYSNIDKDALYYICNKYFHHLLYQILKGNEKANTMQLADYWMTDGNFIFLVGWWVDL